MQSERAYGLFDAILFDIDGTLVDNVTNIVDGIQETIFRFLGVIAPCERIRASIGRPLREQFDPFSLRPLSDAERAEMSDFANDCFRRSILRETKFPEAFEAFGACQRSGLRTGLVTSKSRTELLNFMARYSTEIRPTVAVSASDVENPKPHPESVLLACERLQISPARTAFIGDSVFDVRCARSAGAVSVAVCYGAGDRSALQAEQPDFILEHPLDALEWIKTISPQASCPARK
jgi:HAD superfamily hydrolase (TIGR01549 family)